MEDQGLFIKTKYFVYEFETSYIELSKSQFFEGYCILFSKIKYEHLTNMPIDEREKYLMEMSILGEVMLEVLGAERINYNILGNSYPYLHAHLFPRYSHEDKDLKKTVVWKYDSSYFTDEKYAFNEEKHKDLKEKLANALDKRYTEFLKNNKLNDIKKIDEKVSKNKIKLITKDEIKERLKIKK